MEKHLKIPSISVVVTAYNEGERLSRCLSSVTWVDEIIVVNCSSTDNTESVAKRFTSRVYRQPNYTMLNKNKNFGFSKARSDWILCLDADEVIPGELANEIQKTIQLGGRNLGYWIPRKNIIFGKWITHGLWWPDKQLRFFKRGKGRFPCKHVHEYITVDGPTGELTNPYIHYNYESISQYLWKMEHIYTENEVENLITTEYRTNWFDALRFPISDFVKIYFAQEGYKDGLHGLVLALLQSFYSFLVFAKLWEKQGFVERDLTIDEIATEVKRSGREIHYWLLTAKLKASKSFVKKIFFKILRRAPHL